ncbi:MAG: hypothetical protein ABSF46_07220 [Terriglobia bacterium]|jgi:hypothetical protein
MNIRPEHLSAIRNLGYTDTEARFLYLVATHSGYFTQRHYLDFAHLNPGSLLHRLTTRLLERRHARSTSYANNTHVYNLFSRRIYGPIDKDNLRNRRFLSVEMIHIRLLILAFVIAHSDLDYLETEVDKVRYFAQQAGVPTAFLPGRIYHGIKSLSKTKRNFVDRFPIFLPVAGNALSLPPLVTFTYCDVPGTSLSAYFTHLQKYEQLLRWLPDFNFIFASAEHYKFERAREYFTQKFGDDGRFTSRRLLRYFELRRIWDSQQCARLTRADRDFLREAMRQFKAPQYEFAYEKWSTEGLSDNQARAIIQGSFRGKEGVFQTYLQPERFAVFSTTSSRDYRNRDRDRSSGRFSISASSACEP